MSAPARLLVVGGSGLVGSAVCAAAVGRGWDVTSISRSGQPYASSKGHSPAWTTKVAWHAATPDDRPSFAHLLTDRTAVVHTLGILLEGGEYKSGPAGALRSLFRGRRTPFSSSPNPLAEPSEARPGSYEWMNKDSAIAMAEAFASAPASVGATPSPFVYVSAEDLFRPVIPARYIETKREAERALSDIATQSILRQVSEPADSGVRSRALRPVFVRPSLIYHPHKRPLSTLPAAVLDLSASIQSRLPTILRAQTIFDTFPLSSGPGAQSMANLLTIPPIHVDTVAEAICRAIEQEDIVGPLGVRQMRQLTGFDPAGASEARTEAHVQSAYSV